MSQPESVSEAPLKHVVRLDKMLPGGLVGQVVADAQARADIARLLDLDALDVLRLDYRIAPEERGRALLIGTLEAKGAQRCIVTLEPVPFSIDEKLRVDFWPQAQIAEREDDDDPQSSSPLDDWPEPIVAGETDLGAFLYETFATGLDPYPRKPGAALDESGGDGQGEREHPFAALQRLKQN